MVTILWKETSFYLSLMTRLKSVQPHLPIGLDDQRSILNQLYDLFLKTATGREEIECSWKLMAQ